MTTKARWLVGIAVVVAVLAISVGFAAAGSGGTQHWSGGMMGGTSTGTGIMGSSNGSMSGGSISGGMMSGGMGTMMTGVDMEAMHDQMMALMAGKVPSDVLARCDALHDQMWSGAAMGRAGSEGHSTHHENAGSTG